MMKKLNVKHKVWLLTILTWLGLMQLVTYIVKGVSFTTENLLILAIFFGIAWYINFKL